MHFLSRFGSMTPSRRLIWFLINVSETGTTFTRRDDGISGISQNEGTGHPSISYENGCHLVSLQELKEIVASWEAIGHGGTWSDMPSTTKQVLAVGVTMQLGDLA